MTKALRSGAALATPAAAGKRKKVAARRRLLVPEISAAKTVSIEDVAKIRKAVGVDGDFPDQELQRRLHQAARAYHIAALRGLPWQAAIAKSEKIERAARILRSLLDATAYDCLPASRWGLLRDLAGPGERAGHAGPVGRLDRLLEALREGRGFNAHRAQTFPEDGAGARGLLLGTWLPTMFAELYGKLGHGVQTPARGRFIEACCRALGAKKPSDDAIKAAGRPDRRARHAPTNLEAPLARSPGVAEQMAAACPFAGPMDRPDVPAARSAPAIIAGWDLAMKKVHGR